MVVAAAVLVVIVVVMPSRAWAEAALQMVRLVLLFHPSTRCRGWCCQCLSCDQLGGPNGGVKRLRGGTVLKGLLWDVFKTKTEASFIFNGVYLCHI